MTTVRFDDSLPILAEVVRSHLGDEALEAGTVLRDAVGCLAFFPAKPLTDEVMAKLAAALRERLGVYARSDRVLAAPDDYGSRAVHDDSACLSIAVGSSTVRLVDRRLVGADWLQAPTPPSPPPPRFVFASIKGGVGRSTALAVCAAHLASQGKRVLAVDLDMEAPGLGALLLTIPTLPDFGILDALVENGLSQLDEGFYRDLVGPSSLASQRGRIDVIPVLGKQSLDHPADVLAKIARAYSEDISPDGTTKALLCQVRELVDHFADPARYDVILIDSRAGLHETTAAAVLGLGAEVLLFGLDEPQTFQGYSLLLAHLARFVARGAPLPEWAERLTVVQGKAPADPSARADFARRWHELFTTMLSPQTESETQALAPTEPFKDIPWDDTAADEAVLPIESVEPLAVLYNAQFHGFDPIKRRDVLAETLYTTTFGNLISRVEQAIRTWEKKP